MQSPPARTKIDILVRLEIMIETIRRQRRLLMELLERVEKGDSGIHKVLDISGN
jgi:hypothetical protein